MDELQALLRSEYKPGIFVFENNLEVHEIRQIVEQAGYHFFYLDGKRIVNEEDFFKESQKVLAFPYFGRNWDAFDDCVSDMSWLPSAKGNVILYDDFQQFAQSNPDGFKLAYYGLQHATRVRTAPQPMCVLLRGDKSFLPEVKTLGES